MQTRHDANPICFSWSIFISTVMLWLQKGQSKILSTLGAGGLAIGFDDLFFPILFYFYYSFAFKLFSSSNPTLPPINSPSIPIFSLFSFNLIPGSISFFLNHLAGIGGLSILNLNIQNICGFLENGKISAKRSENRS